MQVGAVTGIGVVESVSGKRPEGAKSNRAFNWLLLAKFFFGWVRKSRCHIEGCLCALLARDAFWLLLA